MIFRSLILLVFLTAMTNVFACESQQEVMNSAYQNCSETQGQQSIDCVTLHVTSLADFSQCQSEYTEMLSYFISMIENDQAPEIVAQEDEADCNVSGHDGFMMSMMNQCVGESGSHYQDRLCTQALRDQWIAQKPLCEEDYVNGEDIMMREIINRHYVLRSNYNSFYSDYDLLSFYEQAHEDCLGRININMDGRCVTNIMRAYRDEAYANGEWIKAQLLVKVWYGVIDTIANYYQFGAGVDGAESNFHNSAVYLNIVGQSCDVEAFTIDTLENECALETDIERLKACIGTNANEWFAHQPQCKDVYMSKAVELFQELE